MRDGPGFIETILGKLGTPHDPSGELIGFAIVALAAAAWIALELVGGYGLARLLRRPEDPE
ncbi:MAG: hypothetical protein ABWX67_12570 [Allosphingosinicella sp.]